MIRVVDAIMGTGKSSAAITYINEHPDKRFVYITPYLGEARRISKACPGMSFFEPQKTSKHHGSKILHTFELVENGENVTTTHQAFKFYPPALLDKLRENHYTVIIDECVDVFQEVDVNPVDVQIAIDAGYIVEKSTDVFTLNRDVEGGSFQRLFRMLKTRDMVRLSGRNRAKFFYWQLPIELFTAAEEVFVLTYLFDGQTLKYYFDMNGVEYIRTGIDRDPGGTFRFSDTGTYVPSYVATLPEHIHIVSGDRINAIGESKHALSANWFKKDSSDVEQLKRSVYNYFHNICGVPSDQRMWGTYAEAKMRLRGKGYSNGFVMFNQKACNEYRDRTALAYCVNIFMNVGQKLYFADQGIEVDEDAYALSVMIQWIWRSAIRDGKDIQIYIPSKRMRELLINWMKEVSLNV